MPQLFPDPPLSPLAVPAGGTSPFQPFSEMVGGGAGDPTMFIALVKLGSGCTAAGGADPRILLSADAGVPTEVKRRPDAASVRNAAGEFVADCMWDPQGDGVVRVQVFLAKQGSA